MCTKTAHSFYLAGCLSVLFLIIVMAIVLTVVILHRSECFNLVAEYASCVFYFILFSETKKRVKQIRKDLETNSCVLLVPCV